MNFFTSLPTAVTVPTISWPGTIGKMRAAPLVANLMQVAVADAAERDLDLDVCRAGRPALERERCQRRLRRSAGKAS